MNVDAVRLARCVELAKKGRGCVSPNPRVGAVVVSRDGEVISEGFHEQYGQKHAEVAALSACPDGMAKGGTLYVNLEPCCYTGHTPPCTEAIMHSGIERVVISSEDPNPKVNGKGVNILREFGISVSIDKNTEEANYLNRGYFSHVRQKRSWCAAKIALSIDGKMANSDGYSKWITGKEARKVAHAMRADHDGILVGGNTVKLDDPELTVRMVDGVDPVRIVLAGSGKINENSIVVRTASQVRTILVVDEDAEVSDKLSGMELLRLPTDENDIINPLLILQKLPSFGVLSVLIEGGSRVLSSFIEAGLIDEISVGIAPTIIGNGISPMEHFVPKSWNNRPSYSLKSYYQAGSDLIVSYVRKG